ncbi:hypothetical protein ACFV6F_14995 [Kitasatospora phosalacinea]|uniref:hypothetical protein n=1 Tax=Kitasatospora phosalacinea TaxID=2065 RepID=UPI003658A425
MRKTLSALAALLVLPATALTVAPPASALQLGLCTGSTTTTYTPALTGTLKSTTATGADDASLCVVPTHPALHGFTGPFTGTQDLSCTSILTPGSGTETLYWNTGQVSQWSWSNNFQNVNGIETGTATGPITSGPMTGSTLTQVIALAPTTLADCATTGVSQVTGSSTWTFA